jgi:hypothetical protein
MNHVKKYTAVTAVITIWYNNDPGMTLFSLIRTAASGNQESAIHAPARPPITIAAGTHDLPVQIAIAKPKTSSPLLKIEISLIHSLLRVICTKAILDQSL